LLLTALLLSSVFNGNVERWPVVAGQYAFAYLALAVILVAGDPQRWRAIAFAFLAGILVMEAVTFGFYFYYDGDYGELTRLFSLRFVTGAGRIGSFVGNPNYHAALIACTLPFIYYFTAKRWIPLWGAAISLALLVAALVYTASNTGLATAVIVTVLFIVAGRIRMRPAYFAAAAFAAVAFTLSGAPLPRAFENRVIPALKSGNIEEAGTFLGRADLIKEAWDIADDTLVLGLGVDRYREFSREGIPVHNSYLLLWTEGGVPALLGWVGIISVLAACAITALRRRPLEAALGLSVFLVFMIFSTATPHMYARIWMVPVLLAIASCFIGPVNRGAAARV
jgi:O-antigen ligase